MNRPGFIATLIFSAASLVQAAAPRTFVASTGLDSNPCSLTAPCRSFGAAVTQTNSGGSVIVLDSAGYGPVTLSKSISLIAPSGVYGGITATTGDAITIAGATTADVITLRGLSIEGAGGANGVSLAAQSLGVLRIENCSITDFVTNGISFQPANNGAALEVSHTHMSGCYAGIYTLGSVVILPRVSIDHCRAEQNSEGFVVDQALGTITNSIASGNAIAGFDVYNNGAIVALDYCVSTSNGTGIRCQASAYVLVGNSVIANNVVGLEASQADIFSRVESPANSTMTNSLVNNDTQGLFTGTYSAG